MKWNKYRKRVDSVAQSSQQKQQQQPHNINEEVTSPSEYFVSCFNRFRIWMCVCSIKNSMCNFLLKRRECVRTRGKHVCSSSANFFLFFFLIFGARVKHKHCTLAEHIMFRYLETEKTNQANKYNDKTCEVKPMQAT